MTYMNYFHGIMKMYDLDDVLMIVIVVGEWNRIATFRHTYWIGLKYSSINMGSSFTFRHKYKVG